jgi:hypothetical protein
MLTLPETDIPIKSLDEPASGGGAIVIRIDLEGIRSLQILAEDSATQERLRERLMAAYPILERLHEATTA